MNSSFLAKTALFRGISEEEIERMLICLAPREKGVRKGEVVFYAGSVIHEVGMVESG